jgi:hypothetical protein
MIAAGIGAVANRASDFLSRRNGTPTLELTRIQHQNTRRAENALIAQEHSRAPRSERRQLSHRPQPTDLSVRRRTSIAPFPSNASRQRYRRCEAARFSQIPFLLRAPRVHRAFVNDPSAGSPTETLLRLLLPLDDQV